MGAVPGYQEFKWMRYACMHGFVCVCVFFFAVLLLRWWWFFEDLGIAVSGGYGWMCLSGCLRSACLVLSCLVHVSLSPQSFVNRYAQIAGSTGPSTPWTTLNYPATLDNSRGAEQSVIETVAPAYDDALIPTSTPLRSLLTSVRHSLCHAVGVEPLFFPCWVPLLISRRWR